MEVEGQGKRPPRSVEVEITVGEIAMCRDFALRCSRLRSYAGRAGWKGGLVDGMTLYGGIEVERDIAGLTVGKVGEVAVCKLAGVSLDLALKDRGDDGKDLRLPSGSVQVKTSRKPFPTRLVREPVELCDWFVFAVWDGLSSVVNVDGYISRSGIICLSSVMARRGRWINKEVPVVRLLPVRQLLKIRPIHEVL